MPLPRFILWGEYSINAKLLYALLLGRTQLSQKSGWVSEDGNVYVIYTIRQMANDLNRSERTVKAALAKLENAGLIIRVRQSWNRANRIFLQLPDEVQLSSRPEGNICPMNGRESSPCMGQNLPIGAVGMCVNGHACGTVGNDVCGLWESRRLFHRAVNICFPSAERPFSTFSSCKMVENVLCVALLRDKMYNKCG